jgi:hypothetical protein
MFRTHPSSRAGTIGQLVAEVPNGLSVTPPYEKKQTKVAFHQANKVMQANNLRILYRNISLLIHSGYYIYHLLLH